LSPFEPVCRQAEKGGALDCAVVGGFIALFSPSYFVIVFVVPNKNIRQNAFELFSITKGAALSYFYISPSGLFTYF